MSSRRQAVISKLERLVYVCRDGEKGFRSAAVDAETPALHALFTFAADLQGEVRRLAEEVHSRQVMNGQTSPAWLKLL